MRQQVPNEITPGEGGIRDCMALEAGDLPGLPDNIRDGYMERIGNLTWLVDVRFFLRYR